MSGQVKLGQVRLGQVRLNQITGFYAMQHYIICIVLRQIIVSQITLSYVRLGQARISYARLFTILCYARPSLIKSCQVRLIFYIFDEVDKTFFFGEKMHAVNCHFDQKASRQNKKNLLQERMDSNQKEEREKNGSLPFLVIMSPPL